MLYICWKCCEYKDPPIDYNSEVPVIAIADVTVAVLEHYSAMYFNCFTAVEAL